MLFCNVLPPVNGRESAEKGCAPTHVATEKLIVEIAVLARSLDVDIYIWMRQARQHACTRRTSRNERNVEIVLIAM